MKFPAWDDNPNLTGSERAKLRRQYLLRCAAVEICPNGSIKALAKVSGVDRTTIYYALRSGEFTDELTLRLQAGAGRNDAGDFILPAEFLRDPLNIPCEQ